MKILLVDLPVHIPTVMPYSISMIESVLKGSLDEDISVIDLNARFHYVGFREYYERIRGGKDYFKVLEEFVNAARNFYPAISKTAISGSLPAGHDELLDLIIREKPDVVAFSLAFNSQMFFAKGIIDALIGRGIRVIVGGPADFTKINEKAIVLKDYRQLLVYLVKKGANNKDKMADCIPDYSSYSPKEYFTVGMVYLLRTSMSCPYKRCTFCTHHGNRDFSLFDLSMIRKTIMKNGMKKICFIDEDIPIPRLIEIAERLKPLDLEWGCQLRPVENVIPILPNLYSSGLRYVSWGIESGSQRVLDFMQKGTNVKINSDVLHNSKKNGIRNIIYILFGLPTETEEEFIETIKFLEKNTSSIDLVSPTVFGLQRGSRIFADPKKYGIKEIIEEKRTLLGNKINYVPLSGLNKNDAIKLKKRYSARINSINKVPKIINASKEQILNW